MKRRSWLYLIGAAVLLAGAFAWAFRPRPLPVEVAAVVQAPFEQTIDEDGRTRVRNRYVIAAPLSGRLARITLDPGDPVAAGATVARIAPTPPALLDARTLRELQERVGAAQAQLAQASAEQARAEAAHAQALTDLARQRKLEGEGFLSAAARDQAELTARVQLRALEAASAARDAAVHALAQARAAAASTRNGNAGQGLPVISPVSGQVLRVLQRSEAPVTLGTPLLEVADPQDLEIVVDLLSTDAARVAVGARVHVDAAGTPLTGRVRRIEPAAFTKVSALGVEEQRVNVIIDLESQPAAPGSARLGDGFRVDLRVVVLAQADAVQAPLAALFRAGDDSGQAGAASDDRWVVFVVEDGRAERRPIRVAARNTQAAWVREGLRAGEQVIVYPSDILQHARRVSVVRGR
jgi:HlyD family secretion protein